MLHYLDCHVPHREARATAEKQQRPVPSGRFAKMTEGREARSEVDARPFQNWRRFRDGWQPLGCPVTFEGEDDGSIE